MKNKFMIFDWAGNCLDSHGSFQDFETAWDYIMGEMADKLELTEDDFQEFQVLAVK